MAAGAILAGLGSILSGLFSGIANWSATNRTNQQNQKNYEDWKAYNSPASQMERLTDAGLNPYMVNGVQNTLSEPFNVQNNTGISQIFSNMSQAMAQTANTANVHQANQIKKDTLELNKLNSEVRRKLTEVNIKNGNYYGALLMSQGTIQEINASLAQQLFGDKLERYRMQNAALKADLDYALAMNPMKLNFYKGYYPAYLQNLAARTDYTNAAKSHIFWSQNFQNRVLANQIYQATEDRILRAKLGFGQLYNGSALGWQNAETEARLGAGRLGLQKDYYGLADFKAITGLGMDMIGLGSDWRR